MELVIAILGSSVVASLVTVLANRQLRKTEIKKKEAEVAEIVSNTYSKIIKGLSDQVDRLKANNDELEKTVTRYQEQLDRYRNENEQLHKDVKKLITKINQLEKE